MNIEYLPVIDINELQKAIELQYGEDTFKEHELRSVLFGSVYFGEDYSNYCYKKYSWANAPYEYNKGQWWTTEEKVRLENLVAGYLADILPNQKEVLIDISW